MGGRHVGAFMEEVGVTVVTPDGVLRFPLHESEAADAERTRENRATATGGGVTCGDPLMRPPRWPRAAMERELQYFTRLLTGEMPVDPCDFRRAHVKTPVAASEADLRCPERLRRRGVPHER